MSYNYFDGPTKLLSDLSNKILKYFDKTILSVHQHVHHKCLLNLGNVFLVNVKPFATRAINVYSLWFGNAAAS